MPIFAAVDYINSLKEHNAALINDNKILRDHFGLGDGPQLVSAPAPGGELEPMSPIEAGGSGEELQKGFKDEGAEAAGAEDDDGGE